MKQQQRSGDTNYKYSATTTTTTTRPHNRSNHETVDDDQDVSSSQEQYQQRGHLHHRPQQQRGILNVIGLMTIAIIVAIVSVTLYRRVRQQEEDAFHDDFSAVIQTIVFNNTIPTMTMRQFQGLSTLAMALSSQALSSSNNSTSSSSWPYVTLPQFDQFVSTIRQSSATAIQFIEVLPIVTQNQKRTWEEYSIQQHFDSNDWMSTTQSTTTNSVQERPAQRQRSVLTTPQLTTASSTLFQPIVATTRGGTNNKELDTTTTTATGGDVAVGPFTEDGTTFTRIYTLDKNEQPWIDLSPTSYYYAPMWQSSPLLLRQSSTKNWINHNFMNFQDQLPGLRLAYQGGGGSNNNKVVAMSGFDYIVESTDNTTMIIQPQLDLQNSTLISAHREQEQKANNSTSRLQSHIYFPIYDNDNENNSIERTTKTTAVAVLHAIVDWAAMLHDIGSMVFAGSSSSTDAEGMIVATVVLSNTCNPNESFTYQINNNGATLVGRGDHHDTSFNALKQTSSLQALVNPTLQVEMDLQLDWCDYTIDIYPTNDLRESYLTRTPALLAWTCALTFLFTVIIMLYVASLRKWSQDTSSNAIEKGEGYHSCRDPDADEHDIEGGVALLQGNSSSHETEGSSSTDLSQPLTEHVSASHTYQDVTVLVADIDGFATWSAVRDPGAVFALLTTLYQAFDEIAKRYCVFKVESIGDAYVAVTGVPNAQPNHATLMARFVTECMSKSRSLIRKLQHCFGPGTSDLSFRFGIHSGSVTASVVRGDAAKFRLCGETVQIATKMERTGLPGKIQVSHATAELLKSSGKKSWLKHRTDLTPSSLDLDRTYWLSKPSKKADKRQESLDYDVTCDKRYDDLDLDPAGEEEVGLSNLAFRAVGLLTSQIRKIVDERSVVMNMSAACVDDDVSELIHETGKEDQSSNISFVVVDQVLQQIESLVKYVDRRFVLQDGVERTSDSHQALASMESFLEDAGKCQEDTVGDETYWLGHLALTFSAFVHDVMKCKPKETPDKEATKDPKDTLKFSSFKFWDLFMSDQFEDMRSFIFEDPVQQSHFLVAIVSAVCSFERHPDVIPTVRMISAGGGGGGDGGETPVSPDEKDDGSSINELLDETSNHSSSVCSSGRDSPVATTGPQEQDNDGTNEVVPPVVEDHLAIQPEGNDIGTHIIDNGNNTDSVMSECVNDNPALGGDERSNTSDDEVEQQHNKESQHDEDVENATTATTSDGSIVEPDNEKKECAPVNNADDSNDNNGDDGYDDDSTSNIFLEDSGSAIGDKKAVVKQRQQQQQQQQPPPQGGSVTSSSISNCYPVIHEYLESSVSAAARTMGFAADNNNKQQEDDEEDLTEWNLPSFSSVVEDTTSFSDRMSIV